MSTRIVCLSLALVVLPCAAFAGSGLMAPSAERVWPQWQARITLQSSSVSPLTLSRLLDGAASQRGVQGGALLGDYYFATPSFGSFRASGGLLVGSQGGLPLASATTAGSRLGISLNSLGALPAAPAADSAGTLPYLGLGFTGARWRNGLAVTADLGLVAEQPSAAGNVGRAMFGNQALEGALRELRLSPMLQLGVRYTF